MDKVNFMKLSVAVEKDRSLKERGLGEKIIRSIDAQFILLYFSRILLGDITGKIL